MGLANYVTGIGKILALPAKRGEKMRVSVCMATYNGERFLADQLESILQQLEATDELIISDDHSTDQTQAILTSYAAQDKRIHLYKNLPERKGVLGNFTTALEKAQGEVVFLADQDDIWFPDKRNVMVHCFAEHQSAQVVMSDLVVIDGEKEVLAPSYIKLRHCQTGFLHNLYKNSYVGCAMAVRTSFLKTVGLPFPKNLPMHDMWLGLLADYQQAALILSVPLVYYRRHGTTATQLESHSSLGQKLSWRLFLLYYLFKRLWLKK